MTTAPNDQKEMRVHIPIENEFIEGNHDHAKRILDAVDKCHDYIAFNGFSTAIKNIPKDQSAVNKSIDKMSSDIVILFDKKLNILFDNRDFQNLYIEANKIAVSEFINKKYRFDATIYCIFALQFIRNTDTLYERFEINSKLHKRLIGFANEMKSYKDLIFAIGLYRGLKFNLYINELGKVSPDQNSFLGIEGHIILIKACDELKKIIILCERLKKMHMDHALTRVFTEICMPVVRFRHLHKSRGTKESIEFLNAWITQTSMAAFDYCIKNNHINPTKAIYHAHEYARILDKEHDLREVFLNSYPEKKIFFDRGNVVMDSIVARFIIQLNNYDRSNNSGI